MKNFNTRSWVLLVLFTANAAHANQTSSTFPVFWVAGDPTTIANIFQFVAAMFGNGNSSSSVMLGAMTCAALMGFLCAFVVTVMRTQFMIGQWFVATVISMALFIPTTSITVMSFFDETSAMASPRMVVVDHIPVGIAYPAGMASFASKVMSDKFMTWFSSGDNGATVAGASGLMNPLKMLLRMENMYDCSNAGDHGILCENYSTWMQHCPGLETRQADAWTTDNGLNTLLNDDTIAGYVDYHTYGQSGNAVNDNSQFTNDQVTYMPCKQAGPLIYQAMTAYVDPTSNQFSTDIARGLPISMPGGPSTGNEQTDVTAAGAQGQSVLQQMQTSLAGLNMQNNDIAAAIVFHQMVSAGNAARKAGTPQHADEQFTATMQQARIKAVTDQAIQGSMFVSFMCTAMNAFTFIFAGSAPLIILMSVVMGFGGFKIYGSWLMFGVWSQSWLPLATLVSYFTEYSFWQRLSDLQYTGQISQANIDNFFFQASNVIYTGSTMLSSVPIITLSLLSGSMVAFSSLAGKATGTDRDYGDTKHMPGTDLNKAADTDAFERAAIAGGGVFSATAGGLETRMTDRDIAGRATWSASTGTAIRHSNVEAASLKKSLADQNVKAAQASVDAIDKEGIAQEVHHGSGVVTKDGAGDSEKTSGAFGGGRQFQENVQTNASADAGVGAGGGKAGPVSIGGKAGVSVGQTEINTQKNEKGFTQETSAQNAAEHSNDAGEKRRLMHEKASSEAHQRLASAQVAQTKAAEALKTAQDDVSRTRGADAGLKANIGELARDAYQSVPGLASAHAQMGAREGGDAGFAKLDVDVQKYGGWTNSKGVSMAVSNAINSQDHELAAAGLGAGAAMARDAGQDAIAKGMHEDVLVRKHQAEIEGNATNTALSDMSRDGNFNADAKSLGVNSGAPAMPSTPGGGVGAFGKSDPQLAQQQHSKYGDPEFRSNPNHAAEVAQYDALESMHKGAGSTKEGRESIATAAAGDQKVYTEKREHLVKSIKSIEKPDLKTF